MKVVLLETIEGLGSVGQEVKVKDGYARNFLVHSQSGTQTSRPRVGNLREFQ